MESLAIQQSEAFQARIQHDAYRFGIDKVERASQAVWDKDRGLIPLRFITGWPMAWPGYPGGTSQWIKDSITDRRLIFVLSPLLIRWVTSYKVWDALSSHEREQMLAWVLKRDQVDGLSNNLERMRQRRMQLQRDRTYQYTNLLNGELTVPNDSRLNFDVDELLTPLPEYAQDQISVEEIANNPNLMPENR